MYVFFFSCSYLEARKEWFNEDNYARSNATRKRGSSSDSIKPTPMESVKDTLDSNSQAAISAAAVTTSTVTSTSLPTSTAAGTSAAIAT